jgi:hypothetical protein
VSDAEDRAKRDEERLTTADLAGAHKEEASNASSGGTPVEEVRIPREGQGERRPRGTEADESSQPSDAPLSTSWQPVAGTQPAATARSSVAGTATAMAREQESGPLFSTEEARNLRARWDSIQVGFVDEPRRAVEEADSLVAVAMKRLAEQFAEERSRLEGQWDRGGDVSTEDLRIALRRYRSFFGRLLAV